MQDEVKFIFKTLIKVPVIIMVVYAVFNVFAFSLCYFKILGVSYVVMQTAIENNYLPVQERQVLEQYLGNLGQAEMLENPVLKCDTSGAAAGSSFESIADNNERVQYGKPITVAVSANYKFIWPLQPIEQKTGNKAALGLNGTSIGADLSQDQLDAKRDAYGKDNNIVIMYTIPGLKYYPDLS